MRKKLLLAAWVFILGMTALDCHYTYHHLGPDGMAAYDKIYGDQKDATMPQFEQRETVKWFLENVGFYLVVAYYTYLFTFVWFVIRKSRRLMNWTTASMVAGNLFMLTMYWR